MKYYGDYHIHTHFCPHGTKDTISTYIEKAILLGLKEISFTEHAPLPEGFTDPTPNKDSAMRWADVEDYIRQIQQYKKEYQSDIKINLGFEVDYIEGFEQETRQFLNLFGVEIDDAILSVHMLKTPAQSYVCLDFSKEMFAEIIDEFGNVDKVYQKYYQTMEQAILSDLGTYKPIRLGHLTLIEKFKKRYKPKADYERTITSLLSLIKERKMALDVNTAGLFKEDCESIYPSLHYVRLAEEKQIPLVPGSDSHTAEHLTRGFDHMPADILYSRPTDRK
ncbi:histidinol-phosphatase [Gracilibacillus dipsosauri]|uniref:Histidinol-phosphatase n=3 Tax=Gracilibacillus TaxID=74385 RepID=A0A317KZX1_9BACI|nr:histidinol-phosphatase HisJ [Gracilibacillus dipsosauri]PWU69112.1 histidinol-phosphatase [Gracilibacillus dipsosauri]